MDFEVDLRSSAVSTQSAAALFLRAEGAEGAAHLPQLLEACQAIELDDDLDRYQETLLGFGAITMGDIVGALGFDDCNELHLSILKWLVRLTSSSNPNVAALSIYGLGHLKSTLPEAVNCLQLIILTEPRAKEHPEVTLRALALRNLRRLDAELAVQFVDAPAFDEYIHAVEHWIATHGTGGLVARRELSAERDWLESIINQRTKE